MAEEAASNLILKNSISKRPLTKSVVLLDTINEFFDTEPIVYEKYLKLAFANSVVRDASNLHFGPEVGVRGDKGDVEVIWKWLQRVEKMADDLDIVTNLKMAKTDVYNCDARDIADTPIKSGSISAVITSPPYPNEKDYTRIVRLESVLLGFVSDKDQLRGQKKQLVRSNTRGVYKDDADHLVSIPIETVHELANEIEARRIKLNKTSGFERKYADVVRQYFGGMTRHLESIKDVLKPGAMLAYVVGDQASFFRVLIRTGEILAQIAEGIGYEHVETDLFRTRLATATRDQLREEVVILRWPGSNR